MANIEHPRETKKNGNGRLEEPRETDDVIGGKGCVSRRKPRAFLRGWNWSKIAVARGVGRAQCPRGSVRESGDDIFEDMGDEDDKDEANKPDEPTL
jgi:hypothetical protein